jgi:uncharacterized protein YdaU (DUF1376 family)
MASDPAFLFYPGDYQGGTMYLTLEQKGAYMELLILQFHTGGFTEAQAKQVLGICFTSAWHMLRDKFIKQGDLYYNERLKFEIEKRKKYSESRRSNASKVKEEKIKENISSEHMLQHMENENIIGNKSIKKGVLENSTFKNFDEIYQELTNAESWINDSAFLIKRKLQIHHPRIVVTPEILKTHLILFLDELKLANNVYRTMDEVRGHFLKWVKKELTPGESNKKGFNNIPESPTVMPGNIFGKKQ